VRSDRAASKVNHSAEEEGGRGAGEGGCGEGVADWAIGMPGRAGRAGCCAGCQSSKPGGRDWSKLKSGSGSPSARSKTGVVWEVEMEKDGGDDGRVGEKGEDGGDA